MPRRSVASDDGRQVIVPLLAVVTVPEMRVPSVTVMTLPVCLIVALKMVSAVTKLGPRLRSVALCVRFSRVVPAELRKSIVSVVVPLVTYTRIAVEVPVQADRIEAGAICSLKV